VLTLLMCVLLLPFFAFTHSVSKAAKVRGQQPAVIHAAVLMNRSPYLGLRLSLHDCANSGRRYYCLICLHNFKARCRESKRVHVCEHQPLLN
jgi:hypothetical protein